MTRGDVVKKVVLIQLPSPYLLIERWDLPLSLLYLRGYLKKQNYAARIINLAGVKDHLSHIPLDADIYGITVFTPQHDLALEAAKYLKKRTKALVVAGGNHVTAIPEEFLKAGDFDAVVRGEGELTFSDLCRGLSLEEIAGISYVENGTVRHNPDRPFIKDIDEVPFPTFEDINLEEYGRVFIDQPHSRYSVDIITSRGCSRRCAFCASAQFWQRSVRFHSAEYVIAYLDYLNAQGIRDFTFADDNFILNFPRLEKICAKLQAMGCSWACSARSDSITPRIAALLKKSGCHKISLGIETGSDRVLKLIGKQMTVAQHKNAVAILKGKGFTVLGFLMVGLPGEDEEAVQETIQFIKEQPVDYYTISTFVPYPGTPIWSRPEDYGYQFDEDASYSVYCSLSNKPQVESVALNNEVVARHRAMLAEALKDKCTNFRSFQRAGIPVETL
jgi:radical SAM superfamily enzyme YgiQ (UPF0313 family)